MHSASNVIHVDFRRAPPPAKRLSDEWPADTGTVRLLVRSEPDQRGFQSFYVLWRDSDGARGMQAFVNKPLAEVHAYLRECGRDVEVIERIGETLRREA